MSAATRRIEVRDAEFLARLPLFKAISRYGSRRFVDALFPAELSDIARSRLWGRVRARLEHRGHIVQSRTTIRRIAANHPL